MWRRDGATTRAAAAAADGWWWWNRTARRARASSCWPRPGRRRSHGWAGRRARARRRRRGRRAFAGARSAAPLSAAPLSAAPLAAAPLAAAPHTHCARAGRRPPSKRLRCPGARGPAARPLAWACIVAGRRLPWPRHTPFEYPHARSAGTPPPPSGRAPRSLILHPARGPRRSPAGGRAQPCRPVRPARRARRVCAGAGALGSSPPPNPGRPAAAPPAAQR